MLDQDDRTSDDIIVSRPSELVLGLRLNRPAAGNGLTAAMAQILIDHLASAYSDETRLVVFSGAGPDFCVGNGEANEQPGADLALRLKIDNVLALVARAPYFSVAYLHGRTFDAGADLAVTCDWRLASPTAQICFAKARPPDAVMALRRLNDIVGGFRAFDVAVRRSVVPAGTALDWTLVTDIVDPSLLDAYLHDLSDGLKERGKDSIAILREAIGARNGSSDIERVVRSSAAGARG